MEIKNESILEQVSGGLTDPGHEIIGDYEKKDKRIKVGMANPVSGMSEEQANEIYGGIIYNSTIDSAHNSGPVTADSNPSGVTTNIWDIAVKMK